MSSESNARISADASALEQFEIGGRLFAVGLIAVERIIDLRWSVLRSTEPREAAEIDGDHKSTSYHFAVQTADAPVSCATFHLEPWESEPAYRLRGMATAEAFRGIGLGSRLLAYGEGVLRQNGSVDVLWCNARTPAIDFYRRAGWSVCSELFYLPAAGPHRNMMKRLT